jgi:hypothetical protein
VSRRASLFAAALAALLAGCVSFPNPLPRADEGDWGRERARWTRHGELYDRLDTRAFANATFLSGEARLARAERIAAWRAMTPAERAAQIATDRADGEAYDEFFLTFFTPEKNENDLALKHSVWRVALVLPDGEVLPDQVEELPVDPTLRTLYPFIGDFDTLYRMRFVRFPGRPPLSSQAFTLRIAGPSGRLDLAWLAGGATAR